MVIAGNPLATYRLIERIARNLHWSTLRVFGVHLLTLNNLN